MNPALPASSSAGKPKAAPLLEQMRGVLRFKHYSIRTEQTYLDWVKRFILFHGKRHPKTMGADEVRAFLTHLAVEGKVAASTQNQALNALLFLYGQVLQLELPYLNDVERARRPRKLPVVLTRQEARALLDGLAHPTYALDGLAALRQRAAAHGMRAAARQGHRFRLPAAHRARRQGQEGPRHPSARPAPRALAPASGEGQGPARGGSRPGLRQRVPALCPGTQVPARRPRVALAVRVPAGQTLGRSAQRGQTPPPRGGEKPAGCSQGCRA